MDSPVLLNLHKTPLLSQHARTKDPSDWNSVLKHHAKLKNDQAILRSYSQMEASGVPPGRSTLPLVLKACARLQDVKLGKTIHSNITDTQLIEDVRIRTALIDFYCKCGFMDHARKLFDEMASRDLVSWNAMICGYTGNFQYENARALFFRMRDEKLKPNSVTLVSLLSACTEMMEFRVGQEIHSYCLRNGFFDLEAHVGTSLIGFYSRFDVRLSRSVFDSMTVRNVVCWNAIIYGCFNTGHIVEALELYLQMLVADVAPDSVTLLGIVQSCSETECLELAKQVHQIVIKSGFSSDKFLENALINMYGKCECVQSSCIVFESMLERDLASWNAMISAYNNCRCYSKAHTLFMRMQLEGIREDMITLATLLSQCSQCSDLEKGKQLHAYVIKTGKERDVSIGNALLSMYVDFDCVVAAEKIFLKIQELDTVSWNTLIIGLSRNNLACRARDLFKNMQQTRTKPNSFTMVSLLAGCKDKSSLNVARSIHGYIIRCGMEINSSLCTALTDMYMDCGYESVAQHLFWSSSNRDLISWNAMIASYVRNGKPNEALWLFYQMQSEVKPNLSSMVNVLPSCSHMANLPQGRCLHAYIVRKELGSTTEISLGNALLTMYARCGSLTNAETVFRNLVRRDIISWNAMIAGYGMHGRGEDALCIFYQMLHVGERPTSVTFVSVLSTCSHSGLVEKGWELFYSMTEGYKITPEVVHYACMVDLLGRAGRLDEARNFIDSMPIEPDVCVWRALLSACRVYSNIRLAKTVAKKLIELEPMNIGNYILLSNIYAADESWEKVQILREQIKEKGLQKTPGISWMVIKDQVESFTAGDRSHPQSDRIYTKLRSMMGRLMENGYVPDSSSVLYDVDD